MEINISEPYFSLIKDGLKTVEGRKMSPTWKNLKVGDILKIINNDLLSSEWFFVTITKINYYSHSDHDPLIMYLACEGLNQTLPGVRTIEEGQSVYRQWWTEAEIRNYGVMALHLERL